MFYHVIIIGALMLTLIEKDKFVSLAKKTRGESRRNYYKKVYNKYILDNMKNMQLIPYYENKFIEFTDNINNDANNDTLIKEPFIRIVNTESTTYKLTYFNLLEITSVLLYVTFI